MIDGGMICPSVPEALMVPVDTSREAVAELAGRGVQSPNTIELPAEAEAFREEARRFLESYRELPDACFESLGGREKAREVHKALRKQRKAAAAAAGLLEASAATPQSSTATTASHGEGGEKRGTGEHGDAPEPKRQVPLQREASMANGELIDGVGGKSGGAAGGFSLNLVQ